MGEVTDLVNSGQTVVLIASLFFSGCLSCMRVITPRTATTPLKQKAIPPFKVHCKAGEGPDRLFRSDLNYRMKVQQRRRHKQSLCINCRFLLLSCPKSVIGHPELIEKTGFRLKDCRNDRQRYWLYTQILNSNQPVNGTIMIVIF